MPSIEASRLLRFQYAIYLKSGIDAAHISAEIEAAILACQTDLPGKHKGGGNDIFNHEEREAIMKRTATATLLILAAFAGESMAGTLRLGDPQNVLKEDTFQITVKGKTKDVKVTPGPGGSAEIKAEKLAKAINDAFGAGTAKSDGDKVEITNGTGTLTSNKTKQPEIQATASVNSEGGFPLYAGIDYHGSLAGVDGIGNESIFSASIGANGFFAASSLRYGELSSATIGGLLTDTYHNLLSMLPSELDPLLSLDIAHERITFALPAGYTDYFVTNYSSDTGIEVTGGMAPIPEAETYAMLLAGLGLLGLIRRRSAHKG